MDAVPHAADDEVSPGSPTISPLSLTSPRAGSGSGGGHHAAHDDSSAPTTWHGHAGVLSDADAIAPPTSTHRLDAGASLLGSPVSDRWFMFGVACQERCPALLAAACAVVLDATRPDGFAMSGLEGDVFTVSSGIGGGGSDQAGGTREISWRVVLCIAPTNGQDAAAAGVLPFPDGPYLVQSTRRGDRWRVSVTVSAATDEGSGAPSSAAGGVRVYDVGMGSRQDLAQSLSIAADTTDDGSYSEQRLARTWRVIVESGQGGDTGSWRTTVHTGGSGTASAQRRAQSSRWRHTQQLVQVQHPFPTAREQRPAFAAEQVGPATAASPLLRLPHHPPRGVGHDVLPPAAVRRLWEVNPCRCPEWHNRQGFAIPILPRLVPKEDFLVDGAIVPSWPRWQIFYAGRNGSEICHAFFRVEDIVHNSGGVLCQSYRYKMDGDSRRWRQFSCRIVWFPSHVPDLLFTFPPLTPVDIWDFEELVLLYRQRRRRQQ
uniref:Uncharacterized protein n=1 Tax=Oryza punctata TaxID=4537 RepID=A0A0E0KXS4_ORYPU